MRSRERICSKRRPTARSGSGAPAKEESIFGNFIGLKAELSGALNVIADAAEGAVICGHIEHCLEPVYVPVQISGHCIHQLLHAAFVKFLQTVGQLHGTILQLGYPIHQRIRTGLQFPDAGLERVCALAEGGCTSAQLTAAGFQLCSALGCGIHTAGVLEHALVEGVVAVQLLQQVLQLCLALLCACHCLLNLPYFLFLPFKIDFSPITFSIF